MPEAEKQQQVQGAAAQEQNAGGFMDLMNQAMRTRSDSARKEVEDAVRNFADLVLKKGDLVVPEDAVKTIQAYIAEIDRKLSEQVNLIIHHADFRALEGTWRGLHYLVNKTETDEKLKIKVFNIPKKELTKTIVNFKGVAWDQSPLFRKIYSGEGASDLGFDVIGGHPFGCLMGDFYFDHSPQDVETLGGLAQICAAAHSPFISAAAPALMGMDSWQELANPRDLTKIFQQKEYLPWRSLRESEDSRYLGLTMPRFLARLPYGPKTVPVEEFHFEEDAEGGDHSKYVWANAAYAMSANITKAFKKYGWCVQIRGREAGGLVEDLPCHVFPTTDGDSDVKCPAEIAIADRREAELSKNGLLPLCYVKNSTDAVFIGAQSLQKPQEFEGPDGAYATSNANLSARLTYLLATCRFAHYLKCIVRDKIGKMMEREELQRYLQEWIMNYVTANPQDCDEELKAKRPLAGAEVEVRDVEGNPGYYNAVFRLRPHFQLEGMNISLRLVSKLQQGK